jgi:hypothetical protein
MATYTNRGGGGSSGSISVLPGTPDEITDYPAGSPPALVSPQVYPLGNVGATVTAGKPRIAHEQFAPGGEPMYTWFVSFGGWARCGKLQFGALLTADSNDVNTHTNVFRRSEDFGVTWSADSQTDVAGFIFNKWFDSTDGRLYYVGGTGKPSPLGQHRTYAFDYGWYANGGAKHVVWPWGASVTGLPWDLEPNPNPPGVTPRHAWDHCYSLCKPIILGDGSLLWSIYVMRAGQAAFTNVILKSVDKGRNWTYLSNLGLEVGQDESSLVLEAGGGITAICRTAGFGGYMSTQRSTDGGVTWNAAHAMMTLSIANGGVGGAAGIGEVAPQSFRLDNGHLVVTSGRVSGGILNIGVCTDGGAGGLGDGGHSVWQRLDIATHHNLYDEGAAAAVAQKIRPFLTSDYSTNYLTGWHTGPNRLTLCYDRTPNFRSTIGAVNGQPNQIYIMDLDFS